jgi:SAM-dependent methyltransferase
VDQTSASNAIDVPAISAGGLVQRGAYGPLRRFLRAFIHFFSYHLILSRKSIRTIRAARFHLRVRPTVFHPSVFLSSEYFAEYLDGLDLSGKSVADIGTGSGILALAAARAGATAVLALDINPNAALSALENAHANGLGDRVTVACVNLCFGNCLKSPKCPLWVKSGHRNNYGRSGSNAATRGKITLISVNSPGCVSTSIEPPCCFTMMS